MSDIGTPDPRFTTPADPDLARSIGDALASIPLIPVDGHDDPVPVTITPDGVVYLTGDVIVYGDDASARLGELERDASLADSVGDWHRHVGVRDVLPLVDTLREEGHTAQPNHAFSASGCDHACDCGPHPALAAQIAEDGVLGLLTGQPMRSQPMRSQPMRSQPMRSQPFRSQSSPPMSTARPATDAEIPQRTMGAGRRPRPLVVVLDTGVADPLPPMLQPEALPGPDGADVFGWIDLPDRDDPRDGYLDPVAGHGTFIAGIVQRLAPGCPQLHLPMTTRFGLVPEWHVLQWLAWIPVLTEAAERDVIVSMSFGGPTTDGSNLLEQAVGTASAAVGDQGRTSTVLVAAAGNDGTCRPYYPAAWPTVLGVGALGAAGAPDWTNYGTWVDVCAAGVDITSTFFTWNGELPRINTVDEDDFPGWAVWSGTSFATPMVVAALARTIVLEGVDAITAAGRVARAPHLARLPGLGTIVNV